MNIGDRIRAAREHAKLTQDGLADLAEERGKKLSVDTIRKVEQGKRNPSDTTLQTIAELCGVRYEWLMDPEDECMTEDEFESYQYKQEQWHLLLEANDKMTWALQDGYNYLLWFVLWRLKDDYDIKMVGKGFEVTKTSEDGSRLSITIDGAEIKTDLMEYAEFKLRKLIASRLKDKSVRTLGELLRARGEKVEIITEGEQDGGNKT